MSTLEKFFRNQFQSHQCQLPPRDEFESVHQVNKFKNLFLISPKSFQGYLKLGNMIAIYHEKLRQLRTTPVLIIHPYSAFMTFWRNLTSLFLFICLLYFPFFSAFHGPFYAKSLLLFRQDFTMFFVLLFIMAVLQVFCILEVIVNFFTGYIVSSTKEIVIHPGSIARHYFCTYFFADLISSIPVDVLLVVLGGVRNYAKLSSDATVVLNLLPLFRLFRMKSLITHSRSMFEYFSSSTYTYSMIQMVCFCLFIVHWGACLIMLCPRWAFEKDLFLDLKYNTSPPWVMHFVREDIFCQYFNSLFRSLICFLHSEVTCDCRHNALDKVLLLMLALIGQLYKVLFLVVFLQMISGLMTGRVLYLEMMSQVREYMRIKRFPEDLKKKVILNFIYLYQKEYIEESIILKLLSESLRREILLRLHQGLIKKVYLFAGLSQALIYDIVSCLKPEIYLEGDFVYKAGDVGNCMYFISFGTVAVYTKEGLESGHLDDGNHFGEVSLILQVNRSETVVAIEPTQLFRLEAQDFAELIKSYPTVYSKVQRLATERHNLMFTEGEGDIYKNIRGKKMEREQDEEKRRRKEEDG